MSGYNNVSAGYGVKSSPSASISPRPSSSSPVKTSTNSAVSFNAPTSSVSGNMSNVNDMSDYIMSRMTSNARDVANYNYGKYLENRDYNEKLYYNARQFYADRDDNAVQRRVKDLIAAGINPVLAGNLVAGNTLVNTPYSNTTPQMQISNFSNAVSSAVSYMNTLLDYEVGMVNADTNQKYYSEETQKKIKTSTSITGKLLSIVDDINDMIKLNIPSSNSGSLFGGGLLYDLYKHHKK